MPSDEEITRFPAQSGPEALIVSSENSATTTPILAQTVRNAPKRPGRGGKFQCQKCRMAKRGYECILDDEDPSRCLPCKRRNIDSRDCGGRCWPKGKAERALLETNNRARFVDPNWKDDISALRLELNNLKKSFERFEEKLSNITASPSGTYLRSETTRNELSNRCSVTDDLVNFLCNQHPLVDKATIIAIATATLRTYEAIPMDRLLSQPFSPMDLRQGNRENNFGLGDFEPYTEGEPRSQGVDGDLLNNNWADWLER